MLSEMQLLVVLLIVILAALVIAAVVIFLAAKQVAFPVITRAAYEVDKFADEMEDPAKKMMLIAQLVQVLGWRRIFLPNAIIGWIIGLVVLVIRKVQAETGCPDLHQKGGGAGVQ